MKSFLARHVLLAVLLLHCLAPPFAQAALPDLKIQAGEIRFGERAVSGVAVQCTQPGGQDVECRWTADGLNGQARLQNAVDGIRISAGLADDAFDQLLAREEMPDAAAWVTSGTLAAAWAWSGQSEPLAVPVRLDIEALSFDSPDGRFAAEQLALRLDITNRESAWRIDGQVRTGQMLIDDFYRDWSQGPLSFSFLPVVREDAWRIEDLEVSDQKWLAVSGRIVGRLSEEGEDSVVVEDIEVNHLGLEFPGAYSAYLESVVAPYTLDGLQVTGSLDWSGDWNDGGFASGELRVSDLTVVDAQRGRFAFTGMNARLRPGDHDFVSRLNWQGLIFGRINLGPGQADLESDPGIVALGEPLDLDVMGGRVTLKEFRMALPGSEALGRGDPDFRLAAHIEAVDMEQVTSALDWPLFSGTLSGDIPSVSLRQGVLDVEGAIEFDVFDGRLLMQDVRVERPFGVLPSVAANLRLEDVDLAQLTQVFSFGRISGRMDGYVNDLRLLDWEPVQFDAWLGTPESQSGKQGISRQAVNHLTSIGGGNATAALTGPVMRLFNNFSYRRLGLGCRLENHVCEVRGLQDDGEGVLIMEGAGVPKITIRAYNRYMDWPQLLANLLAVSEENGVRIGD